MPSNDPDIRNEPHLRPGGVLPNYDPAIDAPLAFNPHPKQFSPHSEEDVDHSVWDEPSLTPAVTAAIPESALTYANWLNERRENWSEFNAWTITLGTTLLSFPAAAFAAVLCFLTGNAFIASNVFVAFFGGPILQEICKIAIPLWIVEKRPYFFTTWFQFFAFGIATAIAFSVVSNFMVSLIVEENTLPIFLMQWVGILGLNLFTAAISTYGLEKIWRNCINSGNPPKIDDGYRYFLVSIGVHVLFAVVMFILTFSWQLNRMLAV